jgi:hypothetical protein
VGKITGSDRARIHRVNRPHNTLTIVTNLLALSNDGIAKSCYTDMKAP